MREIWNKVEKHPKYEVSNKGRVKSLWICNKVVNRLRDTPIILKPLKGTFNRSFVHLNQKKYTISRLVLVTFKGLAPRNKPFALHNDGDPQNNYLSNLRWGSPRENTYDRYKHGTMIYGDKVHTAKLNEVKVRKIKNLIEKGLGNTEIAKSFDVSHSMIYYIRNGKSWQHVK